VQSLVGARLGLMLAAMAIPASPPLAPQPSRTHVVDTTAELRSALRAATAGTVIALSPGRYAGGAYRNGLAGTADAGVVIRAADPANPPVLAGGYNGIQLSNASYVTFQDLIFEGAAQNGISIDDGSTFETPSHHITIARVTIRDLPAGNRDGIKLSGVTDFVIDDVSIERWGDAGSAIDMVGCHRGVVRNSRFRHTPGIRIGNGIQVKGGSSGILISRNRFDHAAARAVQIGGVTSLPLFRPQPHGRAEATDVTVEHNEFIGGEAAVAFVGSDGGLVRFNTIYLPTLWPIRILQEQRDPAFVRARNGVFTDNIVYWRGPHAVNIGRETAPETFMFARNWWFREDAPDQSRPALPGAESAGVYGVDPQFLAPPGDLRTRAALRHGAHARSPSVTITDAPFPNSRRP